MRRLDVFGSAARGDDFDPARSDLGFLVELDFNAPMSLCDAYFGLKRDLQILLGREVDLISSGALESPFVRASIERNREPVYGA